MEPSLAPLRRYSREWGPRGAAPDSLQRAASPAGRGLGRSSQSLSGAWLLCSLLVPDAEGSEPEGAAHRRLAGVGGSERRPRAPGSASST